jgi:hypothetical protein
MTYNRGRKRLGAIKKVLEDASNWREVDSTSQFSALDIKLVTGVDDTQRELLSGVQSMYA